MSKQSFFSGGKKLGILGGGQLGKMLLQCSNVWDIHTKVLDPDAEAASRYTCTEFVQGSLQDFDTVYQFGKDCDVLTIEIEHVNVEALKKLESEGVSVHPKPASLETIQDKGLQKIFFTANQLPTSDFLLFENKMEVLDALQRGTIKIPFVQKTRKAGYDGRGVLIVNEEKDLEQLFDTPSLVEDKVELLHEIAVIAVRNEQGEIKCFDPVLMDFHAGANMLDLLLFPAPLEDDLCQQAKAIAQTLIEKFEICGLLAVEFLINPQGKIFINEVAPRPHNSGHQTIESCYSSQYQQHIRGILSLPLGSTELILPSAMVNLLGAEGHTGPVKYEGLEDCLSKEGVAVHLYGKKISKPFRKMGHVTVTNKDINQAKNIATWVRQTLQVKSH
ncbi:MAG: 5-(carboxyamino)imidazole ribonucleotide synthase [Bacteroidetes bacterium]|nr:5-(carboxyamino)imidazole ribonucleotide synthase [Bacteroidota bacterium]